MLVWLITLRDDPTAENATVSLGSIEAYKTQEKANSMMSIMRGPDDSTERIVAPFKLEPVNIKTTVDKDGQVGFV
jgi:hypothetical protein